MAVTVTRYIPPTAPIAITDGKDQYVFDRPADFWIYLSHHPDLAAAINKYVWSEVKTD